MLYLIFNAARKDAVLKLLHSNVFRRFKNCWFFLRLTSIATLTVALREGDGERSDAAAVLTLHRQRLRPQCRVSAKRRNNVLSVGACDIPLCPWSN